MKRATKGFKEFLMGRHKHYTKILQAVKKIAMEIKMSDTLENRKSDQNFFVIQAFEKLDYRSKEQAVEAWNRIRKFLNEQEVGREVVQMQPYRKVTWTNNNADIVINLRCYQHKPHIVLNVLDNRKHG